MKPQHFPLLVFFVLTSLAQAQLKTGSNPTSVTSTANFEVEATNGNKVVVGKADGYLGVGNATPASSLSVNGSFAGGYSKITATTYALTAADFSILWDGTATGTITLPAAVSGAGNFKGRIYQLRNISAGGFGVNITAAGSEQIGTVNTLTLTSGGSMTLVSTGLTSGSTWEILQQTSPAGIFAGALTTGYDLTGVASVTANIGVGSGGGNILANGTTNDNQNETGSTAEIPLPTMTSLMNSLPNGGVIKIQFPSVTMVNDGNDNGFVNIDVMLPDASGYIGKSFYIYDNISQTTGLLGVPYSIWFAPQSPSLDKVQITKAGGITTGWTLAASTPTVRFPMRYPGYVGTSSDGQVERPVAVPIIKMTAVNANLWHFETGVGTYYNFN